MTFKTSDLLNYRQLWWLDKFLIGHIGKSLYEGMD